MLNFKSLLACAVTIGLLPFAAAEAQTKITYGSYLAARHATNTKSVVPWFEAVEKATNNSLKFELLADGTIVGGRNSLQGIRDNVVDMTIIVDFYTPNDLKTSVILTELSMLGESAAAMTGAVTEMQMMNCPSCTKEAADNNMRILGIYSSTPYNMMCRMPITSAADFKGKRIRASGAWGIWVRALGATPVNITTGEMYEALQRGQIDCTVINIAGLTNYSLADVVKHVVDLPMGTFHGAHVFNMNTSVWNKRTAAEKKAMIDNLPIAMANLVEGAEQEDLNAREEGKKRGIVFSPAPQDLKDALVAHQKTELQRINELAKSRNVKDSEKTIEDFRKLIEKWTRISAEAGTDKAKYAAALKANVYDKVKP